MRRPRPDDIFYHYTDAQGLIGIFRERELWATSVLNLNDASEFRHASQLAADPANIPNGSSWRPDSLDTLLKDPASLIQIGRDLPFVVSFSENGNQLSQWRAYCAKGNGFSIGFTASQLKYLKQHTRFRLLQCAYTEADKSDLVRRTARFMDRVNKKSSKAGKLFGNFGGYERSWIYLTAIKHEGFKEEQEWRLAGLRHEDIATDYRPGRFGVLPYCKLPLGPKDAPVEFERIYVGPNSEPYVAGAAVLALVEQLGKDPIDPFKIHVSDIPYRY
jgi:hypothetical protein